MLVTTFVVAAGVRAAAPAAAAAFVLDKCWDAPSLTQCLGDAGAGGTPGTGGDSYGGGDYWGDSGGSGDGFEWTSGGANPGSPPGDEAGLFNGNDGHNGDVTGDSDDSFEWTSGGSNPGTPAGDEAGPYTAPKTSSAQRRPKVRRK